MCLLFLQREKPCGPIWNSTSSRVVPARRQGRFIFVLSFKKSLTSKVVARAFGTYCILWCFDTTWYHDTHSLWSARWPNQLWRVHEHCSNYPQWGGHWDTCTLQKPPHEGFVEVLHSWLGNFTQPAMELEYVDMLTPILQFAPIHESSSALWTWVKMTWEFRGQVTTGVCYNSC